MDEQTNEQTNVQEFTDNDERKTTFHNFSENPEVVGKLLEISDGFYGKQYQIQTAEEVITVGSYDILRSKIIADDVGKNIKILYKGDITSSKTGMKYKNLLVWIKD